MDATCDTLQDPSAGGGIGEGVVVAAKARCDGASRTLNLEQVVAMAGWFHSSGEVCNNGQVDRASLSEAGALCKVPLLQTINLKNTCYIKLMWLF